eukprot:m.156607 g.156607  ORF g.156607 m.156607 type:complete len:53 (+) comp38690_c0_seq27:2867-3025(+)
MFTFFLFSDSYDLGEVYKDLKLYDKAEQCYLQAIENKCPDEMPTFELAQNCC